MQSDVLSIIIIENSDILKYTYSMKHFFYNLWQMW